LRHDSFGSRDRRAALTYLAAFFALIAVALLLSSGASAAPTVTTDKADYFSYLYKLDGIFGTYEVRVYPASWAGNLAETPLVVPSTTFTDADIHFTQCRTDSGNDNVVDNCEWSNGSINQTNSFPIPIIYPPTPVFLTYPPAESSAIIFEYEFSK